MCIAGCAFAARHCRRARHCAVCSPSFSFFSRVELTTIRAILVLLFLGILATYTGYVIGQMKWKYPHISTMADAGEVIGGKWGREIVGGAWIIFFIFIMSSHLLTFTVAMNTLTDHGTCSVVFGIVGMLISFVLSLPRTLVKMSWLSLVCMCSPSLIFHVNLTYPQHLEVSWSPLWSS